MTNDIDDLPAADVIEVVVDPPVDDDESPNVHQYQFPDSVLVDVIRALIRTKSRLGVTLVLGGQVVHGMMCTPEDYFEKSLTLLKGLSDKAGDVGDELEILFRGDLEDVRGAADETVYPYHVHLLDATTADGAKLGLLRCRIIEVDAWSMGIDK
jgi:hypothetical protein